MPHPLFLYRKADPAKLLAYGFCEASGLYFYRCPILEGYTLEIALDGKGEVTTRVLDTDTGEEYILYRTHAEGAFVGEVRGAIEAQLLAIREACFEVAIFQEPQTLTLLSHLREAFGDTPDYPFAKWPAYAVFRRPQKGKWYAVVMQIPRSKLGLQGDERIEVVNLHADADTVARLRLRPEIHPGWHMNKKYWYTVILDGSLRDEELFALAEISRTNKSRLRSAL